MGCRQSASPPASSPPALQSTQFRTLCVCNRMSVQKGRLIGGDSCTLLCIYTYLPMHIMNGALSIYHYYHYYHGNPLAVEGPNGLGVHTLPSIPDRRGRPPCRSVRDPPSLILYPLSLIPSTAVAVVMIAVTSLFGLSVLSSVKCKMSNHQSPLNRVRATGSVGKKS